MAKINSLPHHHPKVIFFSSAREQVVLQDGRVIVISLFSKVIRNEKTQYSKSIEPLRV